MMGSMLPGPKRRRRNVLYQGPQLQELPCMGSIGAMQQGSADRTSRSRRLATPTKTSSCPKALKAACLQGLDRLDRLPDGWRPVRARMGYCGCATIAECRTRPIRRDHHGRHPREHLHDVQIRRKSRTIALNRALPGFAHFVSLRQPTSPGQHLRTGKPVPRCFWNKPWRRDGAAAKCFFGLLMQHDKILILASALKHPAHCTRRCAAHVLSEVHPCDVSASGFASTRKTVRSRA